MFENLLSLSPQKTQKVARERATFGEKFLRKIKIQLYIQNYKKEFVHKYNKIRQKNL